MRLVCNKVTKKYEAGKVALDSVSFSIESNGIFALIGRNGAGKTTLVRILATQLMPTSGKATIDGMDVVKQAGEIRERIAVVPQEGRTIAWVTPRETIYSYLLWRGFAPKEAKTRATEALKRVKLTSVTNKPNRYLSGGTKRKVLVAQVLASEADIIFLDEPTTGLDPISRQELWKVLAGLKKDHLIFLTTHYLEEAETLADRVGIMEEGKLVGLGTIGELRKKVMYPYSIRLPSKDAKIKPSMGRIIKGLDGTSQIMTTEKEARKMSRKLIDKGVEFSMGPISLDQIFYYFAKKSITEEEEASHEEEYW